MGKIDKEKLLKELNKEIDGFGKIDVIKVQTVIKNFPEEPEIDFDALYDEWAEKPMDWSESRSPYDQARSFRDFLKSKNLTVPNPSDIPMKCPSCGCLSFKIDESMMCSACGAVFEPTRKLEIPVKKTWTLKKEYQEAFKNFNFSFDRVLSFESEPAARRIKYYDKHEEPDYSQIPKGSIVEIEFFGCNGNNCGYVNGITNKSISIGFHMLYNSGNSTTINFDQIVSIVILKLAKEKV